MRDYKAPSSLQSSSTRSRKDQYRPVLWGFTLLFALGLLAAACGPLTAPETTAPPASSQKPDPGQQPTPEPQTPAPDPTPEPEPEPEPEPAQTLPEQPMGEPSRLITNGSRTCKAIAFTYDAGSGADGAAAILDVLKKHQIKSTFFLTGKWAEKYPDLARRIADEGHEIGNHTYSHPDLTKIPPEEAIKNIQDGEEAIRRITGLDPRPLLREPYGAFSDAERRTVRQAGYSYSIYWDVDTLDWQFPGVETLVARLTEKPKNGSIVLMHMNVADTAIASDRAIDYWTAKGYTFTTVSRLLLCK